MSDQKDDIEITYVPDELDGEEDEKKIQSQPSKSEKSKKKSALEKKLQEKLNNQDEIIKKVVKERDELKDKYLRNLAEVDNFRKRIKKEKEDYYKYAVGEFILNLLPVIDNLERALNHKNKPNNEQSIISGVEMIYKQLIELLKKHNIVEIDALKKPFDPNIHQALSKVEKKDIKESMVIEVYQKGYTFHAKLLRPSLTKVAVPHKSTGPESREN
ncbi:MAG: nucleotide exchange factor GrpE [Candidatus Aminicenantes bacterium]|nr:nucleotide exchange factor GrpE [Candidatus Aminicenantes bacterium]